MVFHGVSEADITGFMEYHGMPAIDIGQTWIMPGMAIVFPFRFFFLFASLHLPALLVVLPKPDEAPIKNTLYE